MASDDIQIVKLPLDEPGRRRWRRLALVTGLAILASAPGFLLMAHDQQAKRAASNDFWRIDGRPCAPLDAAMFRDVQRPPSVTTYDGVVFQRHGGAMVCTHRNERIGATDLRYPVCKFDSPDYLAVSAAGRERFYDLTMGRAAAVGVVNGQVRCVVTEAFEM